MGAFLGALSDDDIGYADGDAKMPPLNSVFNPRWRDVTSGTAHPITVEKKGEKKNKVVPDKGIDLTTQAADAWVFSKSSMKHEVKVGKVSKKKGCASKFTNDGTTLASFGDRCKEKANSSSVLAFGGMWWDTLAIKAGEEDSHGGKTHTALHGFVITNTDDKTLNDLFGDASCYLSVQIHEIGHSIGFGHAKKNSIMTPTLDNACLTDGALRSADAPVVGVITKFDKKKGLKKFYPK